MGNTQGCGNLNEASNKCLIAECVNDIMGLPSNSASPTDVWILRFVNGTNYNGRPVDTAVMKWWLNPRSIVANNVDNLLVSRGSSLDTAPLFALDYEADIYSRVINPLVNNNICSNFVTTYASNVGNGCSFNRMLSILVRSSLFQDPDLDHTRTRMALSLKHMTRRIKLRPAIQDTFNRVDKRGNPIIVPIKPEPMFDVSGDNSYHFMINETAYNEGTTEVALTFSKYMYERNKAHLSGSVDQNGNVVPPFLNITEDWAILFQIIAACYALSLTKTVHNDLHSGNIFLIKNDRNLREFCKYTLTDSNKVYRIPVYYKAKLYDFDRAYNKSILGKNGLIDSTCAVASQCNIYYENLDMIKILYYVYSNILNTDTANKALILDMISAQPDDNNPDNLVTNPDSRNELETIFNEPEKGQFLVGTINHDRTTKSVKRARTLTQTLQRLIPCHFNSTEYVLQIIGDKCLEYVNAEQPVPVRQGPYKWECTCFPSIFYANGRISATPGNYLPV